MQISRALRNGRVSLELTSLMQLPKFVRRSVMIGVDECEVEVEEAIWDGLIDIAEREKRSLHEVCTEAHLQMLGGIPLASALSVFVLRYYREHAF